MSDDRDLQGERRTLREVYIRAWRKHREGAPLEPLEAMLADIIARHPEYHDTLAQVDAGDREFHEEAGGANPFVHLGLHAALREQLAADRPAGLKAAYEAAGRRFSDPHALEHAAMECLAGVLWESQSSGVPPDEAALLECIKRLG